MKLSASQINGFLQKPDPKVQVILVYGPDAGLVKERAEALAKKAVDDLNDPFRVTALTSAMIADDPARLMDEMTAQAFGGGKRLVRVAQGTESMAGALNAMLKDMPSCDALLVIEGGDLDKRSKLRMACENGEQSVAIPCYIETGAALQRAVTDILQANGLTASRDVLLFLCNALPPDRLAMRSELEKLALYAAGQSAISMDDVIATIQDAGAAEMDDMVYAVGAGETKRALGLLDRLFAEQTSGVAILRAAQRHFLRLQIMRHHIDQGASANEAVKKLQPPVFWKYEELMIRQAGRWTAPRLDRALHALYETEAAVKRTGANENVLCGQLFLGLAR